MPWSYQKATKFPVAPAVYLRHDGSKVFKSKIAKSWVAMPFGHLLKAGFKTERDAKQYIDMLMAKEGS